MPNLYSPNPLPRTGLRELVNQLELELAAISRYLRAKSTTTETVTTVVSGGSSSGGGAVSDEQIDDRVAVLIQDGTGLTWTYDDGLGSLTGDVSIAWGDITGTVSDQTDLQAELDSLFAIAVVL